MLLSSCFAYLFIRLLSDIVWNPCSTEYVNFYYQNIKFSNNINHVENLNKWNIFGITSFSLMSLSSTLLMVQNHVTHHS